MCVNSIGEWLDLQFNLDFEWQILEKLFHGRFIYSQSFCQKSAENYIFFHISFWCLTWDTNPGFKSNKPTHYVLDYSDFSLSICMVRVHILTDKSEPSKTAFKPGSTVCSLRILQQDLLDFLLRNICLRKKFKLGFKSKTKNSILCIIIIGVERFIGGPMNVIVV